MKWFSYSGFRPTAIFSILEPFVSRLSFGILTFSLPFFALSLGMSFAQIGFLAALRLVAAVVFKPVMGLAMDRFGGRLVYLCSMAGRLLVCIGFVFAYEIWMLFLLRFLHGVTSAARDPAAAVLVMQTSQHDKIAQSFGWYQSARESGAVLGFLLAGFVLAGSDDNYSLVFLMSAILAASSLLLVILFRKSMVFEKPERKAPVSGKPVAHWFDYAVFALIMTTAASMLNSLFPLLATEYAGLDKMQASIILASASVAIILTGPLFGYIADAIGNVFVITLRAVLNITATSVYILFSVFSGLLFGRVLDESGKSAFRSAWGSIMAEVMRATSEEKRGRTVANMDTAQSVGEALGPVIGGWLWDYFGVVALFYVRIVLSVLAELWFILVILRRRPNNGD